MDFSFPVIKNLDRRINDSDTASQKETLISIKQMLLERQQKAKQAIREIRKDVYELMKVYSNIKQIHGFYVDEQLKTISFDILISFDEKKPDELRKQIISDIKNKHPNYEYYIVIDNDFSE